MVLLNDISVHMCACLIINIIQGIYTYAHLSWDLFVKISIFIKAFSVYSPTQDHTQFIIL